LPGKLPAVGLTVSHVAPLLVIGFAVKFVILELELDSVTFCDTDDVLPGAKIKLSEFGFAEIGLDPVEFAFSVTGNDKVVVPEATLIKPTSTPLVGAPVPIETVRIAGVLELEEVTINQPVSE
jgi:hypothetical protein